MPHHYTKNTIDVTKWCNTCRRLTQWHVSDGRLVPSQASNDAQVIEMWLHDRPANTRKAYEYQIAKFFGYICDVRLREVTLGMLQGFQSYLKSGDLKDKSVQCHLSTVKSLFTFAQKIGYIQFNPAAVIKLRKPKDTLAQRLLDRASVIKMIDAEPNPRNRALMRLLYVSGIRSSEAINLKACDLLKHDTGGQITVTAKGGKTLAVWIDQTTWDSLCELTRKATTPQEPVAERPSDETPEPISHPSGLVPEATREAESGAGYIFHTDSGRPLHLNHVLKIVRAAAKRVGIMKPVSPHWLRHATATHLMDAGVSLRSIQEHLGHETITTTERYTHVKPSAANAKLLAW